MKASSKIALWVAAGVAALACIKKKGVAGVGYLYRQAVASRKRLAPYFNGDYLIEVVVVDLTERKGKYVDMRIYFRGRMPVGYYVSMEDVKWLTDLCKRLGERIVIYDN